MKKFQFSIILAILIMANFAVAGAPKPGDSAPTFSLNSLKGDSVSLENLKGKVVLLGMFHICVPCMNQAMEFEKVRNAISSDKLAIVGINTSGDSKKDVEDYLNGFPSKVNFPYLLDPDHTIHSAYIQRDMPTVVIIDEQGVIRARTPGVGADQLIPYLKKMLKI